MIEDISLFSNQDNLSAPLDFMLIQIFFLMQYSLNYLVVTKVANRVLSKMGIIETKNFEIGQSVEVQCLLERTNFVTSDVEIG